jgi:hypothetical protein
MLTLMSATTAAKVIQKKGIVDKEVFIMQGITIHSGYLRQYIKHNNHCMWLFIILLKYLVVQFEIFPKNHLKF